MASETATAPAEKEEAKETWWCNFCGYTTDDQKQYLQHSCTEELKRQGKSIVQTGEIECR